MAEPITPGEIAYNAYMAVHLAQDKIPALAWGYDMLEPHERAGWEAAAQAVRDQDKDHLAEAVQAQDTLTLDLDPDVQREEDKGRHAP